MQEEKKFRTKSGFCHILPDKIVFTRNGVTGSLSKVVVGNGIARILVIYGLAAAVLFYMAYLRFSDERYITAIVFIAIGILLVLGILTSLNNSGTPVIERNRIVRIRFIRGATGVTRSRFEIFFRNEKGRIKKRLILMPGSLNGEKEENEKALRYFKEEGIPIEN